MLPRVVAVLLLGGAVSAQTSQPPAPSRPVQGAEQEQPARQEQPQNPVAPQPSQPAQITIQQTNQDESETTDNHLSDWVVGLLTVGVAALQWRVMQGQLNISGRQNDIIEKQTNIMEGQRVAAVAQSKILERQVALDSAPRVIISEIEMLPALCFTKLASNDGFGKHLDVLFETPDDLSGSFRVTNTGDSDAVVRLLEAVIFIANTLPMNNPAHGAENAISDAPSKLGRGHTARVPLRPITLAPHQKTGIARETEFVFVVGKLIYDDSTGKSRRTGFARRFDLGAGRFKSVDNDPDYEYLD